MLRLFSAPKHWAASLTIIIACGVDARAPGLLPDEQDDGSLDPTAAAGTGGAPGAFAPFMPAGGAPTAPGSNVATGSSGISAASDGGSLAVNTGGAAGSAMNVGGAAGSAMNVGGAAGSAGNVGGAAGSAMVSSSGAGGEDRKSTRLNSSHSQISYAVFCLKKKKKENDK